MNLKTRLKISKIKYKQFLYKLVIIKHNFLVWFYHKKKMLQLWWYNAPKEQKWLEKGSYYLRRGTKVQVGQPLNVPSVNGGYKKMYIKNLYFNFKTNRVTATYSKKPVKGLTEPFIKKK